MYIYQIAWHSTRASQEKRRFWFDTKPVSQDVSFFLCAISKLPWWTRFPQEGCVTQLQTLQGPPVDCQTSTLLSRTTRLVTDGANALAEALKATHVTRFQSTQQTHLSRGLKFFRFWWHSTVLSSTEC